MGVRKDSPPQLDLDCFCTSHQMNPLPAHNQALPAHAYNHCCSCCLAYALLPARSAPRWCPPPLHSLPVAAGGQAQDGDSHCPLSCHQCNSNPQNTPLRAAKRVQGPTRGKPVAQAPAGQKTACHKTSGHSRSFCCDGAQHNDVAGLQAHHHVSPCFQRKATDTATADQARVAEPPQCHTAMKTHVTSTVGYL